MDEILLERAENKIPEIQKKVPQMGKVRGNIIDPYNLVLVEDNLDVFCF